MSKKEDVYITFLKYGKKNINNGVSLNSAIEDFRAMNIANEYHPDHNMHNFQRMIDSIFGDPRLALPSLAQKSTYFINMESYFNLLEYEELKEARVSSKRATYFASIAIAISIFTAGFSIYYSDKQINTPTTISKEQFKKIEDLQVDLDPLENKVDKLTDSVDMAIKTFSPDKKKVMEPSK